MGDDAPCPSAELLRRSLDPDDPMPEQERLRIEEHVDRCNQGCKQAIDALLRDNTRLLPRGVTAVINGSGASSIAAPDQAGPIAPGYEILGVLGRGGMGVVIVRGSRRWTAWWR